MTSRIMLIYLQYLNYKWSLLLKFSIYMYMYVYIYMYIVYMYVLH